MERDQAVNTAFKRLAIGVGGLFVAGLSALVVVVAVFTYQNAPDHISLDPLEEIIADLRVVDGPTEYCPESASSCYGSILVSSGVSAEETAARIAANAAAVGFVEVESGTRPWEAHRGCDILKLYGMDENRHTATDIASDAKQVVLDHYCAETAE